MCNVLGGLADSAIKASLLLIDCWIWIFAATSFGFVRILLYSIYGGNLVGEGGGLATIWQIIKAT
jgi:hypothetical protein